MSGFGHIAVGAAAARLTAPSGVASWPFVGRAAVLSALALLPDIDIVVSRFRTSEDSPIAHRAGFHSIAFAGASGFLATAVARSGRRRRQGVIVALVVGSHGVLDAFGQTAKGVALLWPASSKRLLGPWHVFPSPPREPRVVLATRPRSPRCGAPRVHPALGPRGVSPTRLPSEMTADLQRDGVAASVGTPATALRPSRPWSSHHW
jgi:membrane-bound metal-dependent hydrolase YbcI (DUF457 family)